MQRLSLVPLFVIVAALPACASHASRNELEATTPDRVITVPLAGAKRIELLIPVGEARVTATETDTVRVSLSVRCKPDSKKCRRRAEELQLREKRVDDAIVIVPNVTSRRGYGNGDVLYRAEVPARTALVVDMGYGDLQVEGHAGDLDIKLAAGDISIRMPFEAVASVSLDAQVGDAELDLPTLHIDGPRKLLVGAEVDWAEGPGEHAVSAKLNAGAIEVELYEQAAR